MYLPKMASGSYGLPKVVPLSQNPIILLHQQTPPPHHGLGSVKNWESPMVMLELVLEEAICPLPTAG